MKYWPQCPTRWQDSHLLQKQTYNRRIEFIPRNSVHAHWQKFSLLWNDQRNIILVRKLIDSHPGNYLEESIRTKRRTISVCAWNTCSSTCVFCGWSSFTSGTSCNKTNTSSSGQTAMNVRIATQALLPWKEYTHPPPQLEGRCFGAFSFLPHKTGVMIFFHATLCREAFALDNHVLKWFQAQVRATQMKIDPGILPLRLPDTSRFHGTCQCRPAIFAMDSSFKLAWRSTSAQQNLHPTPPSDPNVHWGQTSPPPQSPT